MCAKSFFLLLLALGCGLVASIGITQVMAKRNAEPVATGDQQTILVAMKEISLGDPLSPQSVKLEPWPANMVPQGSLTTWEDAEGRRTKTKIMPGCPILDSQLLGKGESYTGAAHMVPKGFRTVSVKVDAAAAGGGIIRPADRVDVLVHVKPDSNKTITSAITKTVLQDVKVFAVDDKWDVSGNPDEKTLPAKTISLLVTPEQAEVLTLASELGSIRLVLRNPEDTEKTKLGGTDSGELLGSEFAAARRESQPAKPVVAADEEKAGILDFLRNMNAPKPVVDEPKPQVAVAEPREEPKEVFTVRILEGSQTTDMVLEKPRTSAGSAPGAGIPFWKVNSSQSHGTERSQEAGGASKAPALPPAPRRPAMTARSRRPATRRRARANFSGFRRGLVGAKRIVSRRFTRKAFPARSRGKGQDKEVQGCRIPLDGFSSRF